MKKIADIFPRASFVADLAGLNDLPGGGGVVRLVLERGMLFGAERKWWGDRGRRKSPHEGLDIRYYREGTGAVRALGRVLVPAIDDGTVVRIIEDFLGWSVFVRHASPVPGADLFSIYAHVDPIGPLRPGATVRAGSAIAVMAEAAGEGHAPPHLHLSMILGPENQPEDRLDWKSLAADPEINLIDPLAHIGASYEIADGAVRAGD